MRLKRFGYTELVAAADLDILSTNPQDAEFALYIDNLPAGVSSGMTVAAQIVPNMTVNVTAGVARDSTGQRISVPSTQIVDVSVDSSAVSTSVTGVGNSKIVSLFAKFKRSDSNPMTDGNSVVVYQDGIESFEFKVVQSAEALSPTAPPLDSTMILLADITIIHSQTSVQNTDIALTSRRQDVWVISGTTYSTPQTVRQGLAKNAFKDLLSYYNGHVSGSIDKHPATDLTYAGSGTWCGAIAGISAGTIEAAIDAVVAAVASTTNGASGSERTGGRSVGATITIAAGSVYSQLLALQLASNLVVDQTGAVWASGTAPSPLVDNIQGAMIGIVNKLAAKTAPEGAGLIGSDAKADDLAQGTVGLQLGTLAGRKRTVNVLNLFTVSATVESFITAAYVDGGAGTYIDVPSTLTGDTLIVVAAFTTSVVTNGDTGEFQFVAKDNLTGAGTQIPGCYSFVQPSSNAVFAADSMTGKWTVVTGGTTRVHLQGKSSGGVHVSKVLSVTVQHIRG